MSKERKQNKKINNHNDGAMLKPTERASSGPAGTI